MDLDFEPYSRNVARPEVLAIRLRRNPDSLPWLPWQTAQVSGPSMVPTLRPGDILLARRRARVRPGDVVLARFRDRPDLLVVKRAVRPCDGGWWLASDNPFAAGDSETHGCADPVARVVLRLGPGRPGRVPRPPA